MSLDKVVIIGAGQAGFQVAASLRQAGFQGAVTIVGDEHNIPYQRPPLSKAYLKNLADETSIQLRPDNFYADNRIELIKGDKVEHIDRDARIVVTASGKQLAYDKLAITTGTRPRPLDLPGAGLAGVHALRSFLHAADLRDDIQKYQNITIIGGGFIGLEVAACAAGLGKTVTVLEYAPRLMGRAISIISSDFFKAYHESLGVRIITDARIEQIVGTDRAQGVWLQGGEQISCDLILVGVGAVPNIELAESAGLSCENGILVDEFAVTSDPDIVSAGDCTNHPNPYANGRFRLESVQNAIDQAKVAASSILGNASAYNAAPWFWSDQGDIKLQIVGLPLGTDRLVVRGSIDQKKFSVFHYREDKLIAVESINSAGDHMVARKLITTGTSPTPAKVCDSTVELKSLLAG
ncbi:FAD-dependent oxidoreductase [Pseudomonas sp. B21-056]|jgi:3-phenylpropionate/trans-cinnamate dioxygenase ferredoxin reductase subunit|uniref:NAD(P)/FAD-dependent oxidoreductase n=1 Tax=Pseudomonas sp. B21-056 TaxID=2895495 RepID=UPI002231A772|nr:FAD-dependent oxidoreductase [Pseudomonas sp. B21-056]UZE25923.1 FAD-dependent oxidoreductase [Pseudomonas sp. B21-056]